MFEIPITNLLVDNGTILRDCVLKDLGRINIICGKNNSGKTTLMQAVQNRNSRKICRTCDANEIERLYMASRNQMPWYSPGMERDIDRAYRTVLQQAALAKELWCAGDSKDFAMAVRDVILSDERIRTFQIDLGVFGRQFDSLMADDYDTVLLLPKRSLDLSASIDSLARPEPTGNGTLNYLFFAKNQQIQSPHRELYDKVSKAFTMISMGYTFDVSLHEQHRNMIALAFSKNSSNWISADACGLGLQDLLVILTFAALSDHKLLLIEEPESHMHPDMQRKLLAFLKDETEKQYFIATHSNVFLDNAYVDRVFFTNFDGHITADDITSRASILDDLGYSVTDNLVSDLVVLVEGPTDVPIIEEFLKKLGLYGKYDIKMWPLGGDIMDQLDLSVLVQSYVLMALIDSDPGSGVVRKRFTDNCGKLGIPVHRLSAYSIENYFTLRALKAVFGKQIPNNITKIDPNVKLEEQIGLNVKNNNRRLASAMSLEEIEGTDLMDFFAKIQESLQIS